MMIRAVLFDFGQTLVDSADGFREAERIAKENLFADLFPDLNPGRREAFFGEYRRIRKAFHERSRFSRQEIWKAVYDRFGGRPEPARLARWESQYWSQVKSRTRSFPETLSVLESLKTRFALGLVTNTQGQPDSGTHRIALFPEIERFFSAVVVAGEAGVPPKPDPAPFLLCLQRLGAGPKQAVFVGDDWRIDICGARDAGLRPVWLKHRLVKRSWPDADGTVEVIDSLEGLLETAVLQEP